MAKLTVGFGLVLVVLGVAGFVYTGSHAPTALIPALFGVLLVIAGLLANTENAKKRMLWMHVAVTVGLIGFLVPAARSLMAGLRLAKGGALSHPVAFYETTMMAVLMLAYVALCVQSFIAARKARAA